MIFRHLLPVVLLSAAGPLVGQSTADSTSMRWLGDARALEFMATYPTMVRVIEGYRVQIHLGSKTDAVKVRQTFLQRHPEVPAYLSYLAPNFRIRVGDLRDRMDAERLRQELRSEFPGCYVVQDQIEPPALSKAKPPSAP
ncbi:MAG: SPOR domain-containing protein [Flavobacteriales bacterium]|jgi:hypothetical protein|nr:SPOR domain-containing protein [Flavobacteriales bacterium]MBK7943400.1 SPOR domain-containing protein [Flavobacteriales bacterium]MBK8948050.1 SPOR domain-containing protein [Flavobacteriales bacterium]MBK9699910.1 SPOR domain-containing protein [Flavobacteriales bacterium]